MHDHFLTVGKSHCRISRDIYMTNSYVKIVDYRQEILSSVRLRAEPNGLQHQMVVLLLKLCHFIIVS